MKTSNLLWLISLILFATTGCLFSRNINLLVENRPEDSLTATFNGLDARLFHIFYSKSSPVDGFTVHTHRMYFEEELCFRIHTLEFLIVTPDIELTNHLTSDGSISVSIDDNTYSLAQGNMVLETSLALQSSGENTDIHRPSMNVVVCIGTSNLEFGSHEATLTLSDLDGNIHIASWIIEIEEHN